MHGESEPRPKLVPVSFIRPYEEDIRRIVVRVVLRAGATPSQVFRCPLPHADIERYLSTTGRGDRLVLPFFKSSDGSGVEIASRYHLAGGVERQILMPTTHALPSAVRAALRAALGPSSDRVLVVSIASMEGCVEMIRSHFAYASREQRAER